MSDKKNNARSLIELKDLELLRKLISRNILILIVIPSMAYVAGYVYTYRMTDIYGARVQLLLKSDQTYDYQDPIYRGLGAYGLYTDVSNQTRVLQSKDIIGEVVDKINVDVSYYVVGRLKKKEVFGTLPFIAKSEVINKNIYERPIQVKILDKETYELIYELPEGVKQVQGHFDQPLYTQDFEIILTKNYSFTDANIISITDPDYEIVFHTKDNLIQKFQQNMTITNIEYTSILEVQFQDNINARAKVFLDTLSDVFIDFSKRTQLEVNQNTLDNIEKQISEVQKIITTIENQLLRYKDENDILNLTKQEEEYFSKYVEYTKQKRDIDFNLNSLFLLEEYILTSPDEHILAPSFYILHGEPELNRRVQAMYELQIKMVEQIYTYSEEHPGVQRNKEELGIMKKDLLIYINNLKVALDKKNAELINIINEYKGEIQELPREIQGVDNIRRELEVNNKMYLFLLEKKTNTLIARAGIIPQVQIIEKPSSLGVVGPNKTKINRIFLLFGIVGGLLIAFIRRLFFERVQNVTELASITSLDVIGGVALKQPLETEIVVDRLPKAQITESFRTIRSNLAYYGESSRAKKIVISSFLPSEGKTFCSSNIAAILANSDKKVLLVDFDLHKPKIHKAYNLENKYGISTLLTDKSTFEDVVQKNIKVNLDIITSGPVPPNPSELIMRRQVTDLLDQMQTKYDYIIIDTPPFGLLNDAISLIQNADLFLIVMNTKFANRRGIAAVEKIVDKYSSISKAVVLNGIRESKLKYYYTKYSYKYGYSYGYGYGYGSSYGYGEEYGKDQND